MNRSGRVRIAELCANPPSDNTVVTVNGWVRANRAGKHHSFITLNDGSTLAGLQLVLSAEQFPDYPSLCRITTGTALRATGVVVATPDGQQPIELQLTELIVVGESDPTYPLQKKRHSFEYLREIAHLRPRTNTFGAVFRVRSAMAQAIHHFFATRGFLYVTTPIITANDCEGAGELFRVTTLAPTSSTPASEDFFAAPTGLTVSGQLEGELFAQAFSDIYTFGPTFRAENSNTARHAAEFWMIEPEMAFADLHDDASLAEAFVRELLDHALTHLPDDMAFFDRMVAPGLCDRLLKVSQTPFERIDYSDAIRLLERAPVNFSYPVSWGVDLQTEHERYLCEQVVGGPVFVLNYPRAIKAFYMRDNDDGQTVAAMDLLVPGVGELIGGSQREERLDRLDKKLASAGIDPRALWWYRDSRRWGSTPHAGFGLGFERFLMYLTGMENIRDVIPFPRTPRHAEF